MPVMDAQDTGAKLSPAGGKETADEEKGEGRDKGRKGAVKGQMVVKE